MIDILEHTSPLTPWDEIATLVHAHNSGKACLSIPPYAENIADLFPVTYLPYIEQFLDGPIDSEELDENFIIPFVYAGLVVSVFNRNLKGETMFGITPIASEVYYILDTRIREADAEDKVVLDKLNRF